jgi:hypothetical protein
LDAHVNSRVNPHLVTSAQVGAITGIRVGGTTIANPGGAVNLAAGTNVILSVEAPTHTVTISATGGASDMSSGVLVFHPKAGEQEMVSDLIETGLGSGPVCVTLGIEQGVDEPIFIGPFETFESFKYPSAILGAQVLPSKGSFVGAVRFTDATNIPETLRVRWWACKPAKDMGPWNETEKVIDKVSDKIREKISDKVIDKINDLPPVKPIDVKLTDKAMDKAVENIITPRNKPVATDAKGAPNGRAFIRPEERPPTEGAPLEKTAPGKKGGKPGKGGKKI